MLSLHYGLHVKDKVCAQHELQKCGGNSPEIKQTRVLKWNIIDHVHVLGFVKDHCEAWNLLKPFYFLCVHPSLSHSPAPPEWMLAQQQTQTRSSFLCVTQCISWLGHIGLVSAGGLPESNVSRLLLTLSITGLCGCQQWFEKGVNVWMEVLWEGAKKRRLFHTKDEGERLSIYHKLISHFPSPKPQIKQQSSPAVAENVPACDTIF